MNVPHHWIAMVGFGEAGQAFAEGCGSLLCARARAYDVKTDQIETRESKRSDYDRCGIRGCTTLDEAVNGTQLVLSLVTADQAQNAAREIAGHIATGAIFCDMNSIAPDTKRANAAVIEAAGAHYVDVAIMSPVRPGLNDSPLLLSGPKAGEALEMLKTLGFTRQRTAGDGVGRASAIKMIRSVMIKGLEALTAECVLAASRAGVYDEVIASLNDSSPGADWSAKADYNLDRMMIHGLRRAAEMEEAVKTLQALGTGATMTCSTVERQRAMGLLHIDRPPEGLRSKIELILERTATE